MTELAHPRVVLMGGQACVLYGAAEYSRDLDLAVLATPEALPALAAALDSLRAAVIEVPSFDVRFLERGHAVHFSIPDGSASPLRVDIMSRLRGVDDFAVLWERRTTIALPDIESGHDLLVDVMSLEDLVAAKKTQRDKDWPMPPSGAGHADGRRRRRSVGDRAGSRDGRGSRVLGAPAPSPIA